MISSEKKAEIVAKYGKDAKDTEQTGVTLIIIPITIRQYVSFYFCLSGE